MIQSIPIECFVVVQPSARIFFKTDLIHLLNSKMESCVSPFTAIFEMCPRFWQSTLMRGEKLKLSSRKAESGVGWAEGWGWAGG